MTGKKVHFIGIGGVGMAGLAVLLKAGGNEVSGCDLKPTPRTDWLIANGIPVSFGHSSTHIDESVDVVVATPAISRSEPEFIAAKDKVRFRGEVLAELVNEQFGIAVCGSHGKTTTSTWIAKLLRALGEDVGWCIGGETGNFPVAGVGKGPLVVEADESDGTLALYKAKILVVNLCEYDHPDHFKTEADYFACYDAAKQNAAEVIDSESLAPIEGAEFLSQLPLHNRKNARAAIEVALRRGHSIAEILKVLPEVVSTLPDRRFQRLSVGVYTDYAHHPTEMKCAVDMARQICRGQLRVLFQPHRYSRTKALLKDFPAAFEAADEVVLCPVYAAFEPPCEGGDIADLYAECRGRIKARLLLAKSCEEAWTHAHRSMQDGDITLVLGAGDIIGRLNDLPPKRIWIGAGSNTWKSDLNLGVEYVRTTGTADCAGATLAIPWMVGVPGTIGGWVKMNAGAFDHSISEVIARVKVDGKWLSANECGFSYRHSNIEGEIQAVEFDEAALKLARSSYSAEEFLSRRHRFPKGTYGSFFKNPDGRGSAAKLLDAVGAKELRVGGAYVWAEHANVIVRGNDATASDVLALAQILQSRVKFRFGINLEPEVCGVT